ncbi:DUF393 domain-containing protein [Nocardioides sp. ChNu-153]|uniref:thiol-disulfide oxidoreductase DCC family protein n=1 Tax=unclassified Nocardioides TaxID=2615069 RepID=UPI002407255F|nr:MULTISPECIES: DCC1-like thiol-disulfide oxidoreductase family protein [unclassified Nocardioides]MDF9715671.1 DUF393 domain-containing protein [Nocardioides sp. ChNu-99]MDN7121655.1 DUF393 domain-containing protein [Nocardioides sp. ChNu-153]
MRLTLLYDADCRLCVPFAGWVARQDLLVPLELVPCGSAEARARFPGLDHAATRATVTVVGDGGEVWTHDAAWVVVLWATSRHRVLAHRLSGSAAGRGLARGAAYSAAGLRHLLGPGPGATPGAGGGAGWDRDDDYAGRCADACSPNRQG